MYPRFIEAHIHDSLADTRVVMICGPRQSGKTTLAQHVAGTEIPFETFDDATTLAAASTDPIGFVRSFDRVVIDEVQRVPDLILAIKTSVDEDPRPGRFLLTGSANLMALPRVADSLAGRMGVIRLLPLAQAELRTDFPDRGKKAAQGAVSMPGNRPLADPGRNPARHSSFLDRAFGGEALQAANPVVGDDLVEVVLAGGYPEALARSGWRRRRAWHLDYIEAIIQRDVRDIARIDQLHLMPSLLRILAEQTGQLVNYTGLGAPLGMNHVTTRRYMGVFENLYLVQSLPPWHTNALKRMVKSPKLHFLDTGLLAALRNLSPDRLRRDRTPFGPLLESFVFSEILKLASWADDRYVLSHFRDKQHKEVDIVIENGDGQTVGIEVKASATISSGDFAGLRRLADACGDRFTLGLVLCDHDRAVPFGDRMAAAPIASLWC